MLDLILKDKEKLLSDVKVWGIIGYSYHETVNLRIPSRWSRAKSRTTAMDFRREDFNLFRDLLGRIPWDMILERRKVQATWLIFHRMV